MKPWLWHQLIDIQDCPLLSLFFFFLKQIRCGPYLGSWPSPSPSLYPWSPELNCAISQWHLIVFNYPSTEAEPSFTQVTAQTAAHKFYEPPCVSCRCVQPPFLTVSHPSGRSACPDRFWMLRAGTGCDPCQYVDHHCIEKPGNWAWDSNFLSIDTICEFELWNGLFFPHLWSSDLTNYRGLGFPKSSCFSTNPWALILRF